MTLRYLNAAHTLIDAGDGRTIPVDPGNSDFAALLAAGTSIEDYTVPLDAAKAARITEAWATMQARVTVATVSVTTSAGAHVYGLDQATQDNLQKALLGVLTGLSPNPRPWTPKGVTAPISITHEEVKAIAGAVGFAYEAHVQAYLAHKAAITALATSAAVAAYDLTQGWPA